jgi:hypothetical protein
MAGYIFHKYDCVLAALLKILDSDRSDMPSYDVMFHSKFYTGIMILLQNYATIIEKNER